MATWNLAPDVTHLNHGSFGATPVEVLDLQAELRAQMESNPVGFMLREYQPRLEACRTALARFVGAEPDGLVFVPNATYGVNSVLRSIEGRLQPGDELVVTSQTYNACHNAITVSAARTGCSVVVADVPFPLQRTDDVVDAILATITQRTALVLLDHVTSPTAVINPIEDIVAGLDPSVIVLVDGAHAPGMINVDLAALGVDFYTANCHKWICSPKGAAFLWVAEPYRDFMVAASVSHGYNDGWLGSGSRFHAQFDWTGTDDPTARLCVAQALAVLGDHRSGGWAEVRSTNRELALAARDLLVTTLSIDAPAPDDMLGSVAAVPIPPDPEPSESIFDPLTTALQEKWSIEVPVFAWPESPQRLLRISAQQYNRLDDYLRLAGALSEELAIC